MGNTPGSQGGAATMQNISQQDAQRLGQSLRDRVNQELEQRFRSSSQINPTELREVTQQIDYTRIVQEAFQQAGQSSGQSSGQSQTQT